MNEDILNQYMPLIAKKLSEQGFSKQEPSWKSYTIPTIIGIGSIIGLYLGLRYATNFATQKQLDNVNRNLITVTKELNQMKSLFAQAQAHSDDIGTAIQETGNQETRQRTIFVKLGNSFIAVQTTESNNTQRLFSSLSDQTSLLRQLDQELCEVSETREQFVQQINDSGNNNDITLLSMEKQLGSVTDQTHGINNEFIEINKQFKNFAQLLFSTNSQADAHKATITQIHETTIDSQCKARHTITTLKALLS